MPAAPAAPTDRLTPADQEAAILLSLAYLGRLALVQLAQLTSIHERSVRRRMTQESDSLQKQGLVARSDRGGFDASTGAPSRAASVWGLTEKGERHIRSWEQYPRSVLGTAAQYPARLAATRGDSVARHDALVVATLVALIVAARERSDGLTGVFARLEQKVSPFQPAPWADALLALHLSPPQPQRHPLPWTRNKPVAGEQQRTLLLEIDRGTEPAATIAGKAQEYRRAWEDDRWQTWWRDHYGALPHIVWVVPDAARRAVVQRCWATAWPQGRWYLATVAEAQANTWQRWNAGEVATVQFFVPVTPPAPQPVAARPAATVTPPAAPALPTGAAPTARAQAAPAGVPQSRVASQTTPATLPSGAPLRPAHAAPVMVSPAVLPAREPRRDERNPSPWQDLRWAFWELAGVIGTAERWTAERVMARRGGLLPGMLLLLTTLLLGVAAVYCLVAVALLWLLCGTLETLGRRVWRDARVVRADGTANPRLLRGLASILVVMVLCGLLPLLTWRVVGLLDREVAEPLRPRVITVLE